MIISSNMSNLKGQNYSNNLNSPIKRNSPYTMNRYSNLGNSPNKSQVSFGMFGLDDLLVVAAGMVISRVVGKVIDKVGSAIVKHFRPSPAPTPLTKSAEEHAVQATRDVVSHIGKKIRQEADDEVRIAEKRGFKVNPQTVKEEHLKVYADKLDRVLIPLKGEGYELGLNKVIGFAKLKTGIYEDVLMPLCDVMDGNKSQQIFVPNGLSFFGPMGTGKSYFARQLAEHYVQKGGYFKEIEKLTGDTPTDIATIKAAFEEAKTKFNESGGKKYTMLLIDEIEKMFDRDNPIQRPVMGTLLRLTSDCKDNGVVFMTTANYLDKVEPALLRNGRTDLRIPVGYIEDVDIADMAHYYIKKDGLPANSGTPEEGGIDYKKVLEAVKTEKLQYKPKDVEASLVEASKIYKGTRYKMDTDDVIESLTKAKIDFNSEFNQQFIKDKAYADQQDFGGIYEY